MALSGFDKTSGPTVPPRAQAPIGYTPRPSLPSSPFTAFPVQQFPRPFASLFNSDVGFQARPRSPTDTSAVWASQDAGHFLPGQTSRVQDHKRIGSPLLPSNGHNVMASQPIGNERDAGSFYDLNRVGTPQVTQPPPRSHPGNNMGVDNFSHNGKTQSRLAVSPPAGGNWTRPPGNFGRSLAWQRQPVSTGSLGTQHPTVQVSKHTRPPLLPPTHEVSQSGLHFHQVDSFSHPMPSPSKPNEYGKSLMLNTMNSQAAQHAKSVHPSATPNMYSQDSVFTRISNGRSSPSPPSLGSRPHSDSARPSSQFHSQMTPSAQNIDKESAMTKTISNPVTKRTRSPPITSTVSTHGIGNINQDDHELEIEAKAKRYARFKTELSQPVQSASSIGVPKAPVNRRDPYAMERREAPDEHAKDMAVDLPEGMGDYDVLDSSTVIVGSCTDMCPEAERAERERKGDLDQYERLNGDRNHTSKSLAVKKYNRTAEREADLIRPMPVLQRTVDYLLCLLETPYDDRFLRLYNFLWDRMRAIRMDLRMQHIFNLEAIGMLEQMIRLHIIAMHELCEYAKGEGFSEGFDAHLNIEQMNKTSVELFQMYDDHRKRGIIVPTEKEFRGYYALLKLDKHPGYKVEPAELSLDLSKMTAEIRKTPEILFARDVARVCRTGNFIAFFRLARKASYLQACLMHAHFAKLRTQALASLHSGLQNNQGIPVAHVAKWIAMEEEDLESLLEYHGFSIKEYEEPYMVKEGTFLNDESDFAVKCSKLVHMKKSHAIVEDIISSHQPMPLPVERVQQSQFKVNPQKEPNLVQVVKPEIQVQVIDEEMDDHESASSPKDKIVLRPIHQPFIVDQESEVDNQMNKSSRLPWESTLVPNSPQYEGESRVSSPRTPKYDKAFRNSLERNSPLSMNVVVPSLSMVDKFDQGKVPGPELDSAIQDSAPQTTTAEDLHMDLPLFIENEEVEPSYHDEEAAEARLKLILRTWKRHSSKKKELREQKQLAALWALNSLSLGTPIRQSKDQSSSFVEFNIDNILYERQKQWERSRCRLNVSEVVADTLSARNQTAKCLCWKIILFSQIEKPASEDKKQEDINAGSWLLSKLMPPKSEDENDDELIISSPSLSIWKKWIYEKSSGHLDCCLSIVKEISSNNLEEAALGANAVVFVLHRTISWELQKIRLHNLLTSLSSGSGLPLLILCDLCEETSNPAALVQSMGLHDIDKSRITSFTILFLRTSQNFYCDEKLRGGLQWLASESPSQPILEKVKTRKLVLTYLSSSLAVLDKTEPDQCVSAFNEVIDRVSRFVSVSSNEYPTFWPCPEINLLKKNTMEYESTKLHLPDVGWNSTERIEPILYAFEDCKLPEFHDDISWLYEGSKSGRVIEEQKLKLENCLFRYLTNSSKMMMGQAIATKEASAILQSSARLLLHESVYYIVPNWVKIFRRIFNWRLMILSNEPCSTAYVKEEDKLALDRMMDIEEDNYSFDYPSLDEMIRVGCDYFPDSGNVVANDTSPSGSDEKVMEFVPYAEKEIHDSSISYKEESSSTLMCKQSEDSNKLNKLLDQCNILQNKIDRKLSIYF